MSIQAHSIIPFLCDLPYFLFAVTSSFVHPLSLLCPSFLPCLPLLLYSYSSPPPSYQIFLHLLEISVVFSLHRQNHLPPSSYSSRAPPLLPCSSAITGPTVSSRLPSLTCSVIGGRYHLLAQVTSMVLGWQKLKNPVRCFPHSPIRRVHFEGEDSPFIALHF